MKTLLLPLALAWVCLSSCSSPAPKVCTPGVSVACVGPGACMGAQRCDSAGMGYGECDCGSAGGGAAAGGGSAGGGAGGGSAGGGTGGGAATGGGTAGGSATGGGGTDGGLDAGCDITSQSGCPSNQRCAVSSIDQSGRCAPVGSAGLLQPCSYSDAGFDNCGAGMVCNLKQCQSLCNTDPTGLPGCDAGFQCSSYGTYGACSPTCNPLTQVRTLDQAAACGSPDPANPTLACYGLPGLGFTCSAAAFPNNTHRVDAAGPGNGTAYLNGCAPGFLPLLHKSSADMTVVCIALCAPGVTTSSSPANANGVSPNTCAMRGATGAHEECRFMSMLQPGSGPYVTDVGFCFDYTLYTWDHDNMPSTAEVVDPSCTTLSTSIDSNANSVPDSKEFGCAPRP